MMCGVIPDRKGPKGLFRTVDKQGQSWKHLRSTVKNEKGPRG